MRALPARTWLIAAIAGLLVASLLMLRSIPTAPVVVEAPPAAPVEPLPVRRGHVVALRDIPRGSSVEAAALGLSTVGNPPEDAFTRIEEAAGRVALERIRRGEPLGAARLSPQPDVGGLAPLVPAGLRAVTLRVADDTGVAFLIRPGDHVDLALTARSDPENSRGQPPDLARMLLQDLAVLAVGEALSAEPPQPGAPARSGPPQRNVTLAATPEQLLLIGLARAEGGYLMGLRNPQDRETMELGRTTRPQLLGTEPPPAPRPAPSPPAQRAPRPVHTGPDILRGPSGAYR